MLPVMSIGYCTKSRSFAILEPEAVAIMVTEGEVRGHHRPQLEGPKIVEL